MTIQGSRIKKSLLSASIGVALASLVACGQDPSFLENENKGRKSSDQKVDKSGGETDDMGTSVGKNGEGEPGNGENNNDGSSTVGETDSDGEENLPGGGGNDWLPDWADSEENDPEDPSNNGGTPGNNGSNPSNPGSNNPGASNNPVVIPGAGDNDNDVLYKCLAKWKDHPFKGTVTNYKKISASVSVLGMGNLINDTENTAQPYLILVDAAVNVLGAPTYNLMNRNGYYCMKVNVNVSTNLSINLHCNARLADQKVNVNVGSNQNSSTSAVGVHVLSNVQVNSVRPEGDTCIR